MKLLGVACHVPIVPHPLCSLLQCGNLMLVEVIPKDPLSFSVFHYKNPKLQHTVQVTGILPRPHIEEVRRAQPPSHVSIFKSSVGQVPARQAPLGTAPEETDSGEPCSKDPS